MALTMLEKGGKALVNQEFGVQDDYFGGYWEQIIAGVFTELLLDRVYSQMHEKVRE
jgi:hypothetical protein